MTVQLFCGDCLEIMKTLPPKIVNCCVTSPPYFGLRDYSVDGQIGREKTPEAFVQKLVEVFREVKRVLRDDGTLWLNLGDSYVCSPPGNKEGISSRSGLHGAASAAYRATLKSSIGTVNDKSCILGLKPKDLIGIPWRVAFALQQDGWYLRQDIIWHKPNPMPESVKDRCTKAHEYIFLLSKSPKYYFDSEAMKEPAVSGNNGSSFNNDRDFATKPGLGTEKRKDNMTRNRRSVWTVATKPFKGAHFATFPPDLILPCVLAGCPKDGLVLDPFNGAGTTGLVSSQNGRSYIGIELNAEYLEMARTRIETARFVENNEFFVKKPDAPTLFDFMLEDKQ